MEFKEFKPQFKSAKTRFKLSASLNLKKIWYNFKWNQPNLSRGLKLNRHSSSLNSATGQINLYASSGCWDLGIIKLGFVAKTQFL